MAKWLCFIVSARFITSFPRSFLRFHAAGVPHSLSKILTTEGSKIPGFRGRGGVLYCTILIASMLYFCHSRAGGNPFPLLHCVRSFRRSRLYSGPEIYRGCDLTPLSNQDKSYHVSYAGVPHSLSKTLTTEGLKIPNLEGLWVSLLRQ